MPAILDGAQALACPWVMACLGPLWSPCHLWTVSRVVRGQFGLKKKVFFNLDFSLSFPLILSSFTSSGTKYDQIAPGHVCKVGEVDRGGGG